MTTAQNSLFIENPLIPATRTGTLDLKTPTTAYQLSLKGSTNNARIFLTDLTGNADVRVLNSDQVEVPLNSGDFKTSNTGNAAEAILLSQLSAGTYMIEVALADNAGLASYKLNVVANSDAELSSLFWRNTSTQQTGLWTMMGLDIADARYLDNASAEWSVQARADLNADGEEDLVWRNSQTGEVGFWTLKGGTIAATKGHAAPLEWQILAVKDFDNDGRADILWRNVRTTQVAYWRLKDNLEFTGLGEQRVAGVSVEWQIVKTADLNGDNKADLLWRNSRTGELGIWLTDTFSHWAASHNVGNDWILQTTGDFNNDGKADLVWRNTRNGLFGLWLMNNTNYASAWSTNVPLSWQVVDIGNFNGKGGDEILWRNSTGEVAIWLLSDDGMKLDTGKVVSSFGTSWQVAGVGDFNTDGKTDIVYRNNSQSLAKVALMDGLQQVDEKDHPGVDSNWQLQGVLKREILPFPFNLSDGTLANAFDIGQLNGKALYSDRIRKGLTQYYKFNVSLKSEIRLNETQGNATVELFRTTDGKQLGAKVASGAMVEVEAGTYLIRVSTLSNTEIPYTLEAEGLPTVTNLYGTRFEVLSSNIKLNPSVGGVPNEIDAKFSVHNSGKFTINSFDVGFRISRDSIINPGTDSDAIVKVQNEAKTAFGDFRTISQELKAGETRTFNVKLRLPDTIDAFWLADGKYYVGMVVDPTGTIPEADERDNYNRGIGLDKFETVIRGTETVELIGSQLKVLNKNFAPGGSVTVEYKIQNIGNKAVPNQLEIPIRFYLSTDSSITDRGNDYLMLIKNDATGVPDEDEIAASQLGGAVDGTPTEVTRTVTLLLPETDWSGWQAGNQFYLGNWIYTNEIPFGEQDSSNNKIDPANIELDPTTDTIGKNYVILTRS